MRLNDRRRFQSGAFSPSQLTGNLYWWRSDLGVTVTGGKVAQWLDLISGVPLVPEAVNHEPLISQTAAYNGRPVLDIRGATAGNYRSLISPALTEQAQPITVYAAAHSVSNPANGILVVGSPALRTPQIGTASTAVYLYAGGAGAITSATGVIGTSPAAWCGVLNGAASAVYYNDFATAKASGNAGANAMDRITVGASSWNLGAYSFDGYVAEILVRSGADSAAIRAQNRAYFLARYGI